MGQFIRSVLVVQIGTAAKHIGVASVGYRKARLARTHFFESCEATQQRSLLVRAIASLAGAQ